MTRANRASVYMLSVISGAWLTGCGETAHHEPVVAHAEHADSHGPADASQSSLYKRLGGYDAIAAVADDWLGRLLDDPRISRFFVGQSTDSRNRIRQLAVDQLCAATGGPCLYVGRDTRTTHAGLGITDDDWDISVRHLVATLDKFHVPQREKDDLLALLTTLKPDIVVKS